VGKRADFDLLLDADPLEDIRNIRKVNTIVKDGKIVNVAKLPEKPVFYRK